MTGQTSLSAAILAIGTELTRGELINSNAAWLAAELIALGFDVAEHLTVDDDVGHIEEAVRSLAARSDVLISTGGLGPTSDDLTTEAFARALGVGLVLDPGSLRSIQAFFAARGRNMSPSNEKQAYFPAGAEVLANAMGTAPGFAARLGRCRMFVMPGVPREMRHLFSEQVCPRIVGLAPRNGHQVHLRTFGMPESELGERLSGVEQMFPGVTLGYRAHFPEIEVKVLARAEDEFAAGSLARQAADEVRQRLGDIVFGGRDDSFVAVATQPLMLGQLGLAVADTCTGGQVGALFASVPGNAQRLRLQVTGPADGALACLLGLDQAVLAESGGVSAALAMDMARAALRVSGADLALAVSGVADPGGGDQAPAAGIAFIGCVAASGTHALRHFDLRGSPPERIRTNIAYHALRVLQKVTLGMRT